MKHRDLAGPPPRRILSRVDAEIYVNGRYNLDRLIDHDILQPLGGKKHGRDFDIKDLDHALNLVRTYGWPPWPDNQGPNVAIT